MGYNSQLTDVNNRDYIAGAISVTTSAVEAKVGASRLVGREMIRIYNNDNFITIYYGPSGVTTSTGEPIGPGEGISLPFGDQLGVFVIAASGTVNVRVQEAG
jgi:hypothetical protein